MSSVTFKLQGADALKEVLEKLPEKMQEKALVRALRKGAEIIKAEVVANTPVLSGKAKRSFLIKENRKTRESAEVQIAPARAAFYVMFKEYGKFNQPPHPFIRPAFDAKKAEALTVIGQELGAGIDLQAKKLAGDLNKSGLIRKR